jgi:hypothetical protein
MFDDPARMHATTDERERGTKRLSTLTRGAVAASLALAGAFGALVAHANSGQAGTSDSVGQGSTGQNPSGQSSNGQDSWGQGSQAGPGPGADHDPGDWPRPDRGTDAAQSPSLIPNDDSVAGLQPPSQAPSASSGGGQVVSGQS